MSRNGHARNSNGPMFRFQENQHRNRKRIPTPLFSVCSSLTLLLVLGLLLAITFLNRCPTSDCPKSTSSVVRLNYNDSYEVFITEGRRSLDQARQLVSSRNAKLLNRIIYDAKVLKQISSLIDKKAYWFFRDYNPKIIWTTSYIELQAGGTRPNKVLVYLGDSNNATRKKRGAQGTNTLNASSLVGIWCESWDAMYENTLKAISLHPWKTAARIPVIAELSTHENRKTSLCLRLNSEHTHAHVGYILPKMSSANQISRPTTVTPPPDPSTVTLPTTGSSKSSETTVSTVASTKVSINSASSSIRTTISALPMTSSTIKASESTNPVTKKPTGTLKSSPNTTQFTTISTPRAASSTTTKSSTSSTASTKIVVETLPPTVQTATKTTSTFAPSSATKVATSQLTVMSSTIETSQTSVRPTSGTTQTLFSSPRTTEFRTISATATVGGTPTTKQSETSASITNIYETSPSSSAIGTTSTDASYGCHLVPPFDADDLRRYLSACTQTKLIYNSASFAIAMPNMAVTFDEAKSICETTSSKYSKSTLLEHIHQNPSYFDQLSAAILNNSDFLFENDNSIDDEQMFWTGAYFNAKDPSALQLPSGDRRILVSLSLLENDWCEESKAYIKIIEGWKSEASVRQRYLHVVLKYLNKQTICLKLLTDGDSSSLLIPACQIDLAPKGVTISFPHFPTYFSWRSPLASAKKRCASLGATNRNGLLFSPDFVRSDFFRNFYPYLNDLESNLMWTGMYFDLKNHYSKEFELWWGNGKISDPSWLGNANWCSQDYSSILRDVLLLDKRIRDNLFVMDTITVPVVWNTSTAPGCLQPYTEDVLWPGRSVLPAACYTEEMAIESHLTTCPVTFFDKMSVIPGAPPLCTGELRNYEQDRGFVFISGNGVSPSFLLADVNYPFEVSDSLVCRDFAKGEMVFGSTLTKENISLVKRSLDNHMMKYSDRPIFGERLFWTGGYFDLKSKIPAVIRWNRRSDYTEVVEFEKQLSWCDSSLNAVAKIEAEKAKYDFEYSDKGFFPDDPSRIHVVVDMSSDPCGLLILDDIYSPRVSSLRPFCQMAPN